MKDRRMKNHCMKFLYVKTKDIVYTFDIALTVNAFEAGFSQS